MILFPHFFLGYLNIPSSLNKAISTIFLLVKPKTLSCSPSGFRQVLRWTTLHEFQLDMQQQYQPWCREVNAWRKHVILICLTIGGYPVTPKVHYIYIYLVGGFNPSEKYYSSQLG